jgi:hypothetical protein
MGKLWVVPVVVLLGLIAGCSHTQSVTTNTNVPTPATITLTPTPSASLEIGKTLTLTATPKNESGTAISETVAYLSSNPAVLTVSVSGVACAGSWDNLASPQLCTPGPAGTAQVTATVAGVSSPPTTVYVHQHIDNVSITAAPNQPAAAACVSSGQTYNYQATATSRGLDITSTVGSFTWASTNSTVVTLTSATPTSPQTGLLPGQTTAKANVPGKTLIFATIDGVTSVPLEFDTCPVQSITLEINGAPPGQLTLPVSDTQTITAAIHDSLGNLITGSFLSWNSSSPSSVSVTAAGAVSTPQRGGATVIASCTPPNCNIGLSPTQPIYPENPVQIIVSPNQGTTTEAPASTAWVSSTGCKGLDGCITGIASVAVTGNTTTAPSAGTPVSLPNTPNSMVMDRQGTRIFLGVDSGGLGTKGLMVFTVSGTTVAQYVSTPGKVLAVSPDGVKVIVSDTVDSPNQVFVFDTGTNTSVAFPITGATAADFSPDSLKAYILAANTLYVYSKQDAMQTVPLGSPASTVAFLSQGGFAYVGDQTPAVTARKTCDNTVANSYPTSVGPTPQVIAVPATPLFLRSLPNATILGLDATGFDFITPAAMSPLDPEISTPGIFAQSTTGSEFLGCAAPSSAVPSGLPAVLNTASTFNLGQGNLNPTQLLVSSNGAAAYVLTQNSAQILVLNISQRTLSTIQLTGGATALHAALSSDAGTLYVGASDAAVHILDTLTGADIAQLTFRQDPNSLTTGICRNVSFTCNPDLAVSKQ